MIKKTPTDNVRLPKHIVPIRYSINLTPDLENFTFEGSVEITINIKKSTAEITLHAAELKILESELSYGKTKLSGKVLLSEENETATFTFPKKVPKGKSILKVNFTGILNDKMRGFYRSRYELGGKTYHMGVTQFESTDARRAIPCFDEPEHKAIFDVSLKIPTDRTAISNTLEEQITEHEGGFKTVTFSPTPKMSSYLLAFIVGHFEYIEKYTERGVRVRIFTTPGKRKQAEFALEVATKVTSFYESYFKIPYPMPTMDLVAIPDFAAGAMENWGAITYRETALLVDPENTSTQNKQWVALVIAHEVAHQWFGNLVTMKWWTDLWLNEGFASFMEYKAIDKIFPEWNIWRQFVFIEEARGLELDGLANTHAIEVEVNHPAEISEIFDAVSYSKGASVIRMLAEFLGERDFRSGLIYYLKKHKYANAKTNDLWKALEKISGKPVGKIMHNWTREAGYPLVALRRDEGGIEFHQSRFFSSAIGKIEDKTLWLIPISIISEKKSKPKFYLIQEEKVRVSDTKGEHWLKANVRETSFIRVKYSTQDLKLLKDPIKNRDKHLSGEDRLGIIRDAFALAESGDLSTDEVLDLVLSYKNEEAYVVWVEIISQILRIRNLISEETYYKEFNFYGRALFKKVASKVGWNKRPHESHDEALLRSSAIYALGTCGDKETVYQAQKMFMLSRTKNAKIDSDLRAVVYNLVSENGGKKEYEEFMQMYDEASFQEEKDRIFRALCLFKDEKLLTDSINFAFSDKVKSQDSFKGIAFVWGNPLGREIAWNFLKEHWQEIVEKYEGGHLFSRFVSPASNFTTYEKAGEVEEFFRKNPSEGVARTVAQVVEQINSNASWLLRDSDKIKEFLSKVA